MISAGAKNRAKRDACSGIIIASLTLFSGYPYSKFHAPQAGAFLFLYELFLYFK